MATAILAGRRPVPPDEGHRCLASLLAPPAPSGEARSVRRRQGGTAEASRRRAAGLGAPARRGGRARPAAEPGPFHRLGNARTRRKDPRRLGFRGYRDGPLPASDARGDGAPHTAYAY